ncbi:MAG: hypothetical protein EPO40_12805 [Myxococcaceae bacterium]|nr:MAG: hypothetical protein EPO40_12805 [Myxococcaceae bacterium]
MSAAPRWDARPTRSTVEGLGDRLCAAVETGDLEAARAALAAGADARYAREERGDSFRVVTPAPGRYRLEPVQGPADEPGDEPGAEPGDFELTPEIEAGLADLRAGRTVSLEEADARMRARIAAARTRR